jgi:hypothetical protein
LCFSSHPIPRMRSQCSSRSITFDRLKTIDLNWKINQYFRRDDYRAVRHFHTDIVMSMYKLRQIRRIGESSIVARRAKFSDAPQSVNTFKLRPISGRDIDEDIIRV